MRYTASRSSHAAATAFSYAAFAAAFLACSAFVAPTVAQAQSPRQRGQSAQSQSLPVVAAAQPSPLIAVVSIGRQRVTVYDRSGVVAQSPISSGRRGHDTPEGVFSVIEKKEEHFSNLYDDAPMPFMQRITWSGVALHAGALPGYPASHGCIRLPHSFASSLFKMTRLNTRVVVVPGDVAPMSIAHPALFQPKFVEVEQVAKAGRPSPPAIEIIASDASRPATQFRPADADGSDRPMMLGGRIGKPSVPEASESALVPQKAIVAPLEAVKAAKMAAAEKLATATRAADNARLVHKARLTDVAKAQRSLGPAEYNLRRLESRSQQLQLQVRQARSEAQIEKAREVYARSLEDVIAASRTAREARAGLAALQAEIKAALEGAKSAERLRTQAANEARAAERLTDPISVFVSRRTGRLYIRQGRVAVTDMPISIREPQRPIGTHVFTAVEATNGGRNVAWTIVTVQAPGGSRTTTVEAGGKGRRAAPPPAAEPSSVAHGTAALDRIEFPAEALARVTPYLQPGSSLIVSDLGPSVETGQGTDFVVQTRGEEDSIVSQQKYARERTQKTASNRRN